MKTTYYKAVRPNGTDFYSGSINYLAGGVIKHPNTLWFDTPADAGHYLSVSTVPTNCTSFYWPARLLEVQAVGRVWTPHPENLPNKRAVTKLRVVRELPTHMLFGPQGEEIMALDAQVKQMDENTTDAFWDDYIPFVHHDFPQPREFEASISAVSGLTYSWNLPHRLYYNTIVGLMLRHTIGEEYTQGMYDQMTEKWRRLIGPIHADDADLR